MLLDKVAYATVSKDVFAKDSVGIWQSGENFGTVRIKYLLKILLKVVCALSIAFFNHSAATRSNSYERRHKKVPCPFLS